MPALGRVMTVRGALSTDELGLTLPHEHVLVDFAPVTEQQNNTYDPLEVVETVLPHFLAARDRGVQTIVDATPAFLGRDPLVLRAISERSGIHIVTNSGYYGARADQHLPDHAFEASAEELAERWIREWKDGIGDTFIRPGCLKIGVDPQRLSETDAKLVRAAAVTHRETGLTIASHTGPAEAAFDQLDLLAEAGVHPSAWIWVHAHVEEDLEAHVGAARRGAWVEFDGVHPDRIDQHVEAITYMWRNGLLGRVLVSHDAGWYSVGEEAGGEFRGYQALFDELLPELRERGFTEEDVQRLLVRNPADAFRIRVRRMER